MSTRVGFVGLGNLGAHLAGSLVRAGFDVSVHDLDADRAAELVAAGARWRPSPAALAADVDAVITCLPSPAASAAVLTGPAGVLAGLAQGGVWIEMSTNDRAEIQRIATLAAQGGVVTLEAPVTGGVHLAAAGLITVLVGGPTEQFERFRPVFEAVGREVFHVGPLGSASVLKVITNMLAFTHLVAAGEALMLARRGGIDLATAYHAICASSGTSFVHETESQLVLSGSYDIAFTMELACKDLGFASELGREFGVPLELAQQVERTFHRARDEYGADAWSTMVVKLLEDAVGVDLRATGFPARLEPPQPARQAPAAPA
ncbi:MAG: NAD(P)-dependent oxidoreductase [Kineosporiaceae bacterium]|jgi:3-hydroxyisobutyrate dehydrogenase